MNDKHKKALLVFGVPVLLVLLVYDSLTTGLHEFLMWDDMDNVVNNVFIDELSMENIYWAFTNSHLGVYEPLSWLMKMLEVEIFGKSSMGFLLVTLMIHIGSMLLLMKTTQKLLELVYKPIEKDRALAVSAIVSFLYAIHPLRVEVVAWVSGQSYALAGFFSLLCIYAHLKRRSSQSRENLWYIVSVLSYVSAVLCKTAAVMLPVVIILLDYYPFGVVKDWRRNIDKLPYLLVLGLVAAIALVSNRGTEFENNVQLDFTQKVARASYVALLYIVKTIWPADLAAHYEIAGNEVGLMVPKFFWSVVVILCITGFSVVKMKKYPWLFVILASYLVILTPVLGLVQHGSLVFGADRYTYLSMYGLYIMLGAAIYKHIEIGIKKWKVKSAHVMFVLAVIISTFTIHQIRIWRNTNTLWQNVLKINRGDSLAANNLGYYFFTRNNFIEAELILRRATALDPKNIKALLNYGVTLEKLGWLEDAISFYRKAIATNPGNAVLHNNLGSMYAKVGNQELAIVHYKVAMSLDPDLKVAEENIEDMMAEDEGRLER
jgi:tetratricopeptide (TPR) repeat protein